MLKTLIDIIASPKEAFARLREKPSILFPLLLVIFSLASIQFGYFMLVDFEFIIDELVEQAVRTTGQPEGALRELYAGMNPVTLAVSSAVSVCIFLLVIYALYAGYLTLISKFTNDGIGYRRWFSLTSWTAVPTVFVAVAAWVVILASSDGMVGMRQIQPFSLNNLIFQSDGPFATLLDSLSLIQLWTFVLLVLGYMQWTGRKAGAAAAIVLAPYMIVYGIWASVIVT